MVDLPSRHRIDLSHLSQEPGPPLSLLTASGTSYAFLYPRMKVLIVAAALIAAIVGAAVSMALSRLKAGLLETGVATALIGGVLGIALISVRDALFPQLVIDIGRSGELAQRIAARRRFIFTVLGLTLIGGTV